MHELHKRGFAQLRRKMASVLVAFCLLLVCSPVAGAEPSLPVTVGVEAVSGSPGDTVSLAVYMDPGDNPIIFGYELVVAYDTERLELVPGNAVTDDASSGSFVPDTAVAGQITVQASYFGDFFFLEPNTKQNMFTLHFAVKPSATPGDAFVTVSGKYQDSTVLTDILPANATAGKVTVTARADKTPPTVTGLTYGSSLPVNGNLQVTFDEDVRAVAGKSVVIRKAADDSAAEIIAADNTERVTVAQNTVTIDPAFHLQYGTAYYVQIDPGAFEDMAGNPFAGIADKTTWTFATEAAGAPGTVTIGIGSMAGQAGETVAVDVSVTQASAGVASYGIQVDFDAAALEVSGIDGSASGDIFLANYNNSQGWLKAAWTDAAGGDRAISAGTLFTVRFSLKEGSSAGDKPLTVAASNLLHFTATDAAGVEMQKTLVPGNVAVTIPNKPEEPNEPEEPQQPEEPEESDNGGDTGGNGNTGSTGGTGGSVPGSSGPGGGSTSNPAGDVGTTTTTEVNGQTTTRVAIDPQKLEQRLAAEPAGAVISIPVAGGADAVVGELNGQMVKNMENKEAVLEIETARATYTLPARQINIDAISRQLGAAVALQDIKVRIEIAVPTAEMAKIVENAAAAGEFTVVVPPLSFTVRAVYGDTTIEVEQFNAYVERMVAIPEGMDPNRITTAVVVEPDGTVRHVPTKIILVDGRYYAKVSSLTNSTYAVVWHPLSFSDVADHWAKETVNDMGSRMVIQGVGDGLFQPDDNITRAQFAAIVVRGLGLKPEAGKVPFADVELSAWYSDAIRTAYAYGLIGGFEDGTFRPDAPITREQAMVIVAKAMTITALDSKLTDEAVEQRLSRFADEAGLSFWARNAAAASLQAGIVTGRGEAELAPQANVTRAETAAMVRRLLQGSGLI